MNPCRECAMGGLECWQSWAHLAKMPGMSDTAGIVCLGFQCRGLSPGPEHTHSCTRSTAGDALMVFVYCIQVLCMQGHWNHELFAFCDQAILNAEFITIWTTLSYLGWQVHLLLWEATDDVLLEKHKLVFGGCDALQFR